MADLPEVYTLRLSFRQEDESLRVEYDTVLINKYTSLSAEINRAKSKYKGCAVGDIVVSARLKDYKDGYCYH